MVADTALSTVDWMTVSALSVAATAALTVAFCIGSWGWRFFQKKSPDRINLVEILIKFSVLITIFLFFHLFSPTINILIKMTLHTIKVQ